VVTTPNVYSLRWRTRFFLTGKQNGFDVDYDPEHIHPMMLYAAKRVIFPRYQLEIDRLVTYPEYSEFSRWFARLAATVLSWILPNDLPWGHALPVPEKASITADSRSRIDPNAL
jgi:hypothetical protein